MIFRYIMCVHIISAVVILPFILLHLVNTTYLWCDIECLMHIHLTFMVYVLSFEEQVIEVAFTKHMIYKDYTVCQRLNFSTESMLYTSNTQCVTDWLHYSTKSMACFTEVNCCLLTSLLAQKSDDLLLV